MDDCETVLDGPAGGGEPVEEIEGQPKSADDSDTQAKALEEDNMNFMGVKYGPKKHVEEYEGQIKSPEDDKMISNTIGDGLDKAVSVKIGWGSPVGNRTSML